MIYNIKNLNVSFKKENQTKLFGKERQKVLKNISFSLEYGKCLGIIGESGSGKSTLGKVLSGLLQPDSGDVFLDNIKLYQKDSRRATNHKSSIVFQDYTSSVNPRFLVKDIIYESLINYEVHKNVKLDKKKVTIDLLERVGLSSEFLGRYPHQLSGGQLQRVCIARAIAVNPKVIIFDEAVSSLDVSTQTQVMDLLISLRKKHKYSYVFITHDLTTITYLCDSVMFMYDGEIVENISDINDLHNISHEYSKKLLNSIISVEL